MMQFRTSTSNRRKMQQILWKRNCAQLVAMDNSESDTEQIGDIETNAEWKQIKNDPPQTLGVFNNALQLISALQTK